MLAAALALALAAALAATRAGGRGGHHTAEERGEARPTLLVESIRRQLMADNYDYLPSISDEADLPPRHQLRIENVTTPRDDGSYDRGHDRANELDSSVNDNYIMRARESSPERPRTDSRPVATDDLLYYVDDARLTRRAAGEAAPDTAPAPSTRDNVTYKVLEVGSAHRRRGGKRRGGAVRRFIRERVAGGGGVALLSLDSRPFPQFRLPRARRQYMAARRPHRPHRPRPPDDDVAAEVGDDNAPLSRT